MVKGGQLRKCRFFFSARCRPQCLCKFFSVGQLSQKRLSIFCCCYCCCCCFCFCCCISSSWLLWLECFKESTCCPAIIGCQCIILNFFLVVLFRFVVAIISSQFLKIELLLSMLVVFFSFCFYWYVCCFWWFGWLNYFQVNGSLVLKNFKNVFLIACFWFFSAVVKYFMFFFVTFPLIF